MGKWCFVPNCKSRYRSCTERVSFFKAPRQPERLDKWRRAIPRTDRVLESTDHVCSRHFPEGAISATYHAEYMGRVLLHTRKKPTLSSDAVPSIFSDCPKYPTVQQKPRKPPRKRQALLPTSRKRRGPKGSTASEVPNPTAESTPNLLRVETATPRDGDAESAGTPRKRPRFNFGPRPCEEEDASQHNTGSVSPCAADSVRDQAGKVSVPPAIMRRRAATSHKQTTSCETGPSESTQAETLTTKVPMRMQTNELGDFHESSSAPQVPLESKVPLVQGNSSGASCAMQGHAKVGDATQENCQIKMEAGTSCIVKRENPFSANVCLVVSPYGCGICSRSFEEVDAVFSHVMACPWPEPFRCVLCPELCTNWGTARNHVVAHIQRRTPKCPLCGYAFGKQWTVERHVQMHHLPIRPFVCNCCGGTFTAKADIYKHSPQCRAKSQAIEKYLGSRKKSDSPVHGPVPTTVYKCSVCTRAFLDRLVMARHMRVHVNQVQQSRADEEVKKDPFDCGNHKSYGIGPPKVKNGVKVYTQCFIKIPVADKTTGCKAFSKATQTDLSSSTVSSWTQCDNVEDSEDAF